MNITEDIKKEAEDLCDLSASADRRIYRPTYYWRDNPWSLWIDMCPLQEHYRVKTWIQLTEEVRNIIFLEDSLQCEPYQAFCTPVVVETVTVLKGGILVPSRFSYLTKGRLVWHDTVDFDRIRPMNKVEVEVFMISKALPKAMRSYRLLSGMNDDERKAARYQLYWAMAFLGCDQIRVSYNEWLLQNPDSLEKGLRATTWKMNLPKGLKTAWTSIGHSDGPLGHYRGEPMHVASASMASTSAAASPSSSATHTPPPVAHPASSSAAPNTDSVTVSGASSAAVTREEDSELSPAARLVAKEIDDDESNACLDDLQAAVKARNKQKASAPKPQVHTASAAAASTSAAAAAAPAAVAPPNSTVEPRCTKCKSREPLTRRSSPDDDGDDSSDDEDDDDDGDDDESDSPKEKSNTPSEKFKYETMCSICKGVCAFCRTPVTDKTIVNKEYAATVGYYVCKRCSSK